MSSRWFTGRETDAVVVSAMTVQSNLTQLIRERCVSRVCGNGDTYVEGVLTILLVIDPLDRLRRMGVAPDEMRREFVMVDGSMPSFYFFSIPTEGCIMP